MQDSDGQRAAGSIGILFNLRPLVSETTEAGDQCCETRTDNKRHQTRYWSPSWPRCHQWLAPLAMSGSLDWSAPSAGPPLRTKRRSQ